MAGENRQERDPLGTLLIQKLQSDPYGFDFFRALRAIENEFEEKPKIGCSLSPNDDAVRFGQSADLSFQTSTIEGVTPNEHGHPPRINMRFFGLLGPNGPLPAHLTEFTRDRVRNARDTTLASFFNVFHHRVISLFYRAWAVNQKSVDQDRPGESKFPDYIGSFFGIGQPLMRGRDSVPDNAKIYYAGRLSAQTRNVEGLEAILGDFFEVPATVENLIGHWLSLPREYQCGLGVSRDSAALGENSVLGERVWDVQTRFRVRLGPLKFSRYADFLPFGKSFKRLNDWIAFYTSLQFRWDIQLQLAAAEVPPIQLGMGSLLGWTSWLQSQPRTEDSDDLIINP